MMAGAVIVTLNQGKTWAELEHELGMVEPDLIFNDGIDYGYRAQLEALYGAQLRPMDAWTAAPEAEMVNRIDHEGLLMLMFTSGTTGRSKGVMLSEKNYFTACQMYIDGQKDILDQEERLAPQYLDQTFSHFTLVPMFHLAGFICYFVYGIQGWTLNLCCDARDLRRDMSLMHSDAMSTPPVLVDDDLTTRSRRGHADRLNGLWNLSCSSAILDPAILSDLVKNGFYINQCYSMTELAGYGLLNVTQEGDHLRALGKPDGFCEVKVDETGEICVRGGCVMLGYYKDPETTAETIDKDGWLHSGDLARRDENGRYKITGRIKDMIIRGGENIYPQGDRGLHLHPPQGQGRAGHRRAVQGLRRGDHGLRHPQGRRDHDRGGGQGLRAHPHGQAQGAPLCRVRQGVPHERRRQDPQVQDARGRRAEALPPGRRGHRDRVNARPRRARKRSGGGFCV